MYLFLFNHYKQEEQKKVVQELMRRQQRLQTRRRGDAEELPQATHFLNILIQNQSQLLLHVILFFQGKG